MDASESTKQTETEVASTTTIDLDRALQLLSEGQLELVGQVLASSNIIFLASVEDQDLRTYAIYKPHRGERPLWDFPDGTLHQREVAAHVVSQALGAPWFRSLTGPLSAAP